MASVGRGRGRGRARGKLSVGGGDTPTQPPANHAPGGLQAAAQTQQAHLTPAGGAAPAGGTIAGDSAVSNESLHPGGPPAPASVHGNQPNNPATPGGPPKHVYGQHIPNMVVSVPKEAKPVELSTNFFTVEVRPSWVIHQYCISYIPDVLDKNVRKRLLYQQPVIRGSLKVFDGRMLYMPLLLPPEESELQYQLRDGTPGTIHIKYTNRLTPESTQCIQIYNIIFRTCMYHMQMKEIGRNFYLPETSVTIPGHFLDVWTGMATSIQHCHGGLKLCVDTSFKILCQKTALHDLYEIYDSSPMDFQTNCKNKLPGKVVITRYNNKTYTIEDIDFDQTPLSKFTNSNGKQVSYAAYMKQQYNISITDSQQPLLVIKDTKRASSKSLRLIPECCNLTGIPDTIASNPKYMRDITTHTRLNPENRHNELLNFVDMMNSNSRCQQEMEGWQISIPEEMDTVKGFILKPENLYLGNNGQTSYNQEKADWLRETRGKKLMAPAHFHDWLLICDQKSQLNVHHFVDMLHRVAPPMGVQVTKPHLVTVSRGRKNEYVDALQRELSQRQYKLVVCVIPRNDADMYNVIKKYCYCKVGVPNQVIVSRTIGNPKQLMTIATKVLMLCIIKMGAEPWHVNIPVQELMVVGIDTYHDIVQRCSVNAFVSTRNRPQTQYHSRVSMNPRHQELLHGLKSFMKSALEAYNEYPDNNGLPKKILIYRDGVGDGQLKAVKEKELADVYEALKEAGGPSYEPQVCFVVCQKRVNARFAISTPRGMINPPPGTVISESITRSEWEDFFMVSQAVNQGTVSPTHYIIIHNSIPSLTKDRLYTLTYKMCHLYYNFQATVSVPAPCQYAHKLAYLVGQSLHELPADSLVNSLYYL